MDHRTVAALTRRVSGVVDRRAVLAWAAALPLAASALWRDDASARRKRRRKRKPKRSAAVCAAPQVLCGEQCLAAGSCCTASDCGLCHQCVTGACTRLADGTRCGVGGTCAGGTCTALGAFGCTLAENSCAALPVDPCPGSATANANCFITRQGTALCGIGTCTAETNCANVPGAGAGAVLVDCPLCGIAGTTLACVLPVTS